MLLRRLPQRVTFFRHLRPHIHNFSPRQESHTRDVRNYRRKTYQLIFAYMQPTDSCQLLQLSNIRSGYTEHSGHRRLKNSKLEYYSILVYFNINLHPICYLIG